MNHQSSANATGTAVRDLNNRIGVILTRCELLEQHCQLGTRATTDVEAIRKAAEALATMVNRLSYNMGLGFFFSG